MDYVTGVLLMVMSGMAVLLNFAILWIVLRSLKDRKEGSYNIIVASLAMYDLSLAILGLTVRGPAMVVEGYFDHQIMDTICQISGYIIPTLSYGSSLTVVGITLNRMVAITSPLKYKSKTTTTLSWVVISVIAGILLIFNVVSLLLRFDTGYDETYGRCSFSKTQAGKDYVLGANTMFLVAPFLITAIIYVKLVRAISQSLKLKQQSRAKSKKMKIFSNISSLIILYFISWAPYYLIQILGASGVKDLDPRLRKMSFVMFYMNLVIDPLVYAANIPVIYNKYNRWKSLITKKPPPVIGSSVTHSSNRSPSPRIKNKGEMIVKNTNSEF